jgi:anti-sigma factor RsiW
MKKCEEFELAISCFVDGELDRADGIDMFNHLASCERCAAFLEDVIRMRNKAAREGKHVILEGLDVSAEPTRGRAGSHFLPDAELVQLAARRKHLSASVRTFVLAILVLIIGCVMFSTTISIDARGASAAAPAFQSNPNAGIR